MAVKTITIDLEAYKRLKQAKDGDESFSQTIKRVVPVSVDLDAWFAAMDKAGPFSKKFVRTVEGEIAKRRARIRRKR